MKLFNVNTSHVTKQMFRHLLNSNNLHTSALLRKTYYEILRVPSDASQNQIKESYYKLSKIYHPDIAQDENSLKMFREITEAYDTLGNIKSRLQYDKETGNWTSLSETPVPTYGTSSMRDTTEGGVLAPDYKKFMSTKTAMEQWEDQEYLDRRLEVQMKKYGRYQEDPNYIHTPVMNKLLSFGAGFLVVKMIWMYIDTEILDYYA